MATPSSTPSPASAPATLAPHWHTGLFIGVTLAVAVTGALLQSQAGSASRSAAPVARISGQYFPLLIVQWGLLFYVCRVGRTRNELPALLGQRWLAAGRFAADLVLAFALGAAILVIEWLSVRVSGVGRNAALASLLPSTVAERLTWVLVAVSVGFCEEVVYRGYLQTQLAALTKSPLLGVLLQALVFGIAHAEQGPRAALRVALYGLFLGLLAQFRRSLLPGIACHVGIDLASGLFRG